ncbi:MAG TPA: hypothetical protein VIS96_11530 [Terrimicrobiaceae bacterium]
MKIAMRAAATFLLAAVLTTGCSSFDRAWQNPPAQSGGVAGRWQGRWQSARTGHNGKLRAIIVPQTAARYDARFRATYRSVLAAEYSVTLNVKQRGPRSEFRGAAHLGMWGRYETTGYATRTQFHAAYRSKFDYGTFEMQCVGE